MGPRLKRLIYGPWPFQRGFRLSAYGFVVLILGFGVAMIADSLDSPALLMLALTIITAALAFMFYLSFSKGQDRMDGT
jgi:hypothetical protein